MSDYGTNVAVEDWMTDDNWESKWNWFKLCPGCGADDIVEQPEICAWCGFKLRDGARLQIRKLLMGKMDRYFGMPTLMYDEIIDSIAARIVSVEEALVKTCGCCGGQRIPEGIDHLHYEPRNGLCLFELDGCKEAELIE